MVLLFFDFGSGEILLIVLAIFLVFGPGKIPELARNLGRFMNEMKRATEDIKTEINREADKLERKKKLEEYKKQLNLEGDQTKKEKENEPDVADVSKKVDKKEVASEMADKQVKIKENEPVEQKPETEEEKPVIRKPEGSVPSG